MKKITLAEYQQKLLCFFKYFSIFLEENNIKYMICSGTALGCVRHGGFIPWDDDIDLIMDRVNYNKLIEILPKFENEDYTFDEINLRKDYLFPYIKVYDKRVIIGEKNHKKNSLMFIDIFPLDNIPSDEKMALSLFKKIRLTSLVIVYKQMKFFTLKNNILKNLMKNLIIFFCKFISIKRIKKIYKNYSNLNYEKSKMKMNFVWSISVSQAIDEKIFLNYEKIKFEDIDTYIMKEFDVYLRALYGDYMILPPIQARHNHGAEYFLID